MKRNRLTYAATLFIFVLLAVFLPSEMTFFALYTIALAPFLSFLLTAILYRGVLLEKEMSAEFVGKGEEAVFFVVAKNQTIFPIAAFRADVFVGELGLFVKTYEEAAYLKMRGQARLLFAIETNYAGEYEVGVKNFYIYDYLGLFAFKRKVSGSEKLLVLPRVLPISDTFSMVMAEGEMYAGKWKKHEVSFEESELKQHLPTEDSRNIHWKVSAKRDELIGRHFLETEQARALLFIDNKISEDFSLETLDMADKMLEVAASFAYDLHEKLYALSLMTACGAKMEATNDFFELHYKIANIDFGVHGRGVQLLDTRDTQFALMIVLLHTLDEAICDMLKHFAQKKQRLVVLCFDPLNNEAEMQALRQAGIVCENAWEVLA